jgi:hypothetical protein
MKEAKFSDGGGSRAVLVRHIANAKATTYIYDKLSKEFFDMCQL